MQQYTASHASRARTTSMGSRPHNLGAPGSVCTSKRPHSLAAFLRSTVISTGKWSLARGSSEPTTLSQAVMVYQTSCFGIIGTRQLARKSQVLTVHPLPPWRHHFGRQPSPLELTSAHLSARRTGRFESVVGVKDRCIHPHQLHARFPSNRTTHSACQQR